MQRMIHINYLLLFFKNDSLKYTATFQGRSFNSLTLFYIFLRFHCFLFYDLFYDPSLITLMHKETSCNLCSSPYTLSFCYAMYYIESQIYIGRRLLEDCFYCYSQHIISSVAIGILDSL